MNVEIQSETLSLPPTQIRLAQVRLRRALGPLGCLVDRMDVALTEEAFLDGRSGVECRIEAYVEGVGSFVVRQKRRDALAAVVFSGQLLRQCLQRRLATGTPEPIGLLATA